MVGYDFKNDAFDFVDDLGPGHYSDREFREINTVATPWYQYHVGMKTTRKKCSMLVWCPIFIALTCTALCFALIAVIICSNLSPSKSIVQKLTVVNNSDICISAECAAAASTLLASMNASGNPCGDFHNFVCGKFIELNDIPETVGRYGQLQIMAAQRTRNLKAILEESVNQNDSNSSMTVKTFYASCMNEDLIRTVDRAPINQIFASLGTWPVLDKGWNDSAFLWEILSSKLISEGFPGLLNLNVETDSLNSTFRILTLQEFELPLERQYLQNGINSTEVQAFLQYTIDVATLLGADLPTATSDMNNMLLLIIALANIASPEYATPNVRITTAELKANYRQINFDVLFSALPSGVVQLEDRIALKNLTYLNRTLAVLNQYPKRVLANLLLWRPIEQALQHMPDAFQKPYQNYEKILSRDTSVINKQRYEICLAITLKYLSIPLSPLYLRKYFNEKAKLAILPLVKQLRNILVTLIQNAAWLDNNTRQEALLKAANLQEKIAYPDDVWTQGWSQQGLEGVIIRADSYHNNIRQLMRTQWRESILALKQKVNRTTWDIPPTDINAYYDPQLNEIVFPAGILAVPMFSSGVPAYYNFAKIGQIIGHEITHGFDRRGREFDSRGNNRNWWSDATLKEYNQKVECITAQFNAIVDDITNIRLDGSRTLEENIADYGGLKIAFEAYKQWFRDNASTAKEQWLPGLTAYDDKQLFFIAYAQNWCQGYTLKTRRFRLTTDTHSLAQYSDLIKFVGQLPIMSTDQVLECASQKTLAREYTLLNAQMELLTDDLRAKEKELKNLLNSCECDELELIDDDGLFLGLPYKATSMYIQCQPDSLQISKFIEIKEKLQATIAAYHEQVDILKSKINDLRKYMDQQYGQHFYLDPEED